MSEETRTMQTADTTTTRAPEDAPALVKKIGKTTYKVRVHLSETANETMEDKILRLIRNDGLANQPECGIMELPQMSRPSERSA